MWTSTTVNNCNTYLIDGPMRILVDPGHTRHVAHVEEGLSELDLGVQDIDLVICTHSHPDHIEGVQIFKENQVLTALHGQDWELARAVDNYMMTAFGIEPETVTPEIFLKEGKLSVKGIDLDVVHTPGHSPGSISLYWPQEKVLITGDLIFKDGIGRTDIPGGNSEILKQSITKLRDFDVEHLLPGHGELISGKENVTANFVRIEQFWLGMI